MTQRTKWCDQLTAAIAILGGLIVMGGLMPAMDPPLPARRIDLAIKGQQAKDLAYVYDQPAAGPFVGELVLRPLKCDVSPSSVLKPCKTALDFKVPHKPLGSGSTDLCIFSVVMGEEGVGEGQIVPAKDVPELADDAPVFELHTGYALVGGQWPVAKGKRSRGGAPGTQFVIEMGSDGTERYYLLNSAPGHSVTIRVDGFPETKLDNPDEYVEVPPETASPNAPVKKSLPSDVGNPYRAMRDNARTSAKDCTVPGEDKEFTMILAKRPTGRKDDEPSK